MYVGGRGKGGLCLLEPSAPSRGGLLLWVPAALGETDHVHMERPRVSAPA